LILDKGAEAVIRKRLFPKCRPVILLLFVLLASVVAQGADRTLELYVFPEGSNQADGSMANPYGSLPEAVDAVRALRRSGNTEPAVIYLREGRHQLNETLVLGMEDGAPSTSEEVALPLHGAGEATSPAYLTIAAYPGEHPVVSAGVSVTDWKRLESAPPGLPEIAVDEVWVADMPEDMERFYTLYDGQGRLNRARNAGFAPTKTGDRIQKLIGMLVRHVSERNPYAKDGTFSINPRKDCHVTQHFIILIADSISRLPSHACRLSDGNGGRN
jgi:hypothetical protein